MSAPQQTIKLYTQACEFAYAECKKHGRTGGPSDHVWLALSTGRFAELLVRACADAADEAHAAGCEYAGDFVAEHMGFGEQGGVAAWRAK